MNDSDYIAQIYATKTPRELLKFFVECGHMLQGDSYYREFQDALLETAERLSTDASTKGKAI